MVPVSLAGVYPVGPESFLCGLLHWEAKDRYVPVWLPAFEGARLLARLSGWEPTRPTTEDVLVEALSASENTVQGIELTGFHEGIFMATLTLGNGSEVDARASDALILSVLLDLPLEMDESVAAQTGLWLSPEDAMSYFELDIGGISTDDESASGDAQADAEFEQLMRDLGVEPEEISGDELDDDV